VDAGLIAINSQRYRTTYHPAMPSHPASVKSRPPAAPLHVVLVEDDAELRDAIFAPALVAAGCSVVGVGSAAELYRAVVARAPDVLVLDIGLPDENGFQIASHFRAHSDVGIIMLTSRASAADRVRGLDGGADAFLPKPVDVDVLCATVRSVERRLRRPSGASVDRWALEADGWRLVAPDGMALSLNAMERALLQRLFATPNMPIGREQLIAELVDDTHAFDPHRLDMLMHRLRRKLAGGGMPGLPLRAVRGSGYVLVAGDAAGSGG
jgi:DNA-binding response OmpR family regulator